MIGFEEIVFLFNSAYVNRGRIRLDFDEAALLWQIVRLHEHPRVLEIGRLDGGSTIMLAAAAGNGVVHSIDIAPRDDAGMAKILKKLDLRNVTFVVGDSHKTTRIMGHYYDVVFIDGDHSYEGARRDYLRWSKRLKTGGHILFHDMVQARGNATARAALWPLYEEIKNDFQFVECLAAGSLVAFVKTCGEAKR